MLLPMIASADAVVIDGIYYNLISKTKTAEVTTNPDKPLEKFQKGVNIIQFKNGKTKKMMVK